jgi:hypothetical protein
MEILTFAAFSASLLLSLTGLPRLTLLQISKAMSPSALAP